MPGAGAVHPIKTYTNDFLAVFERTAGTATPPSSPVSSEIARLSPAVHVLKSTFNASPWTTEASPPTPTRTTFDDGSVAIVWRVPNRPPGLPKKAGEVERLSASNNASTARP
jgi:hypothetical protein